MAAFVSGPSFVPLQQNELATFQGNGSVALNSRRTLPYWFDGRFLAARDLAREQQYFLQRQADLGRAAGFGVVRGLMVRVPPPSANASADTLVIGAGQGVTPSGELVLLTADLTVRLADLVDDQNLDVQFGLSTTPQTPPRTRTGVFVLALRPVEFTANPIVSYPTSIGGTRGTQDGDVVEATAVSLVPFPDPVSVLDPSMRRAALARTIFLSASAPQLSPSLLPLAIVSVADNAIEWVDVYLVRRETAPDYSGLRFGLANRSVQQAFLQQYDAHLVDTVTSRVSSQQSPGFAAATAFQALPPAGRFPLATVSVTSQGGTPAFSQTFFPQQTDVRLSIVPDDEIAALFEDSMALPPIDLTQPDAAFANVAVFALIRVPRAQYAALKSKLPVLAPQTTAPRVLAFAAPIELLRIFRGGALGTPPSASDDAAWASAIGTQTYGYYTRRRSSPTFVDFTLPPT
ncbi:MAG TPA: hypothetical protein VHT53_08690 [Candidatus Elarobacter sp.]|nr:hypothetical protein [Candidatus Elarobacter sp.]